MSSRTNAKKAIQSARDEVRRTIEAQATEQVPPTPIEKLYSSTPGLLDLVWPLVKTLGPAFGIFLGLAGTFTILSKVFLWTAGLGLSRKVIIPFAKWLWENKGSLGKVTQIIQKAPTIASAVKNAGSVAAATSTASAQLASAGVAAAEAPVAGAVVANASAAGVSVIGVITAILVGALMGWGIGSLINYFGFGDWLGEKFTGHAKDLAQSKELYQSNYDETFQVYRLLQQRTKAPTEDQKQSALRLLQRIKKKTPDLQLAYNQLAKLLKVPPLELTVLPQKSPEVQEKVHTVAPGESLSLIAKKYYGNPSLWSTIFNANQDQIKNPDLIQVGWKLKIPNQSSGQA